MADIRTITILPAQTISGASPVQGNTGSAQGTTSLAGLAPGTILSGFIVNRDASGNPILRTDTGSDITFSSNFFLNIGSEVSIRVENSTAGTLAHILSVNGQPPEIAAAQSAFGQEPEVIVSQNLSAPAAQPQTAAATATTPETNTTTLTVTGTLVAQSPSSSNALQTLPAGTQITLRITGLTTAPSNIPDEILNNASPPQQAPSVNSQPANPAFYTTYARAAEAPALPGPATPTLTAPVTVTNAPQLASATPVAVTPATTANLVPSRAVIANATPIITQTDQTPPFGGAITATVISNDASQETHLQTAIGIIRLQPGTILPMGSRITFEITETAAPQTAAANAAASATPTPLTELAQQWTSLQQIVSLLMLRNPAAGLNVIQDIMPWVMLPSVPTAQITVPQNIPAGLMLFMAALRGGNFGNWLGQDNVQWLQSQGHDDIIKKAASEFMTMAKQFTEAQPLHWQPLFFPIAVGGELHQARLFVKRDRRQGNNPQQGKRSDNTRFVVEVDLTQLGEMQMDGFVRRQDKNVQFDLIIRNLTPLPQDVQNDILQIYNNTGELAGYKGSLAFQTVKDFPVNPMEEIVGHTGTVVV